MLFAVQSEEAAKADAYARAFAEAAAIDVNAAALIIAQAAVRRNLYIVCFHELKLWQHKLTVRIQNASVPLVICGKAGF